jgi:hypothetical protein
MSQTADTLVIGYDAEPTMRLRIRSITPTTGRLEQLWKGSLGEMWVEVQRVDVNGNLIMSRTEGE